MEALIFLNLIVIPNIFNILKTYVLFQYIINKFKYMQYMFFHKNTSCNFTSHVPLRTIVSPIIAIRSSARYGGSSHVQILPISSHAHVSLSEHWTVTKGESIVEQQLETKLSFVEICNVKLTNVIVYGQDSPFISFPAGNFLSISFSYLNGHCF